MVFLKEFSEKVDFEKNLKEVSFAVAVWEITHSLKLMDYLQMKVDKPCYTCKDGKGQDIYTVLFHLNQIAIYHKMKHDHELVKSLSILHTL